MSTERAILMSRRELLAAAAMGVAGVVLTGERVVLAGGGCLEDQASLTPELKKIIASQVARHQNSIKPFVIESINPELANKYSLVLGITNVSEAENSRIICGATIEGRIDTPIGLGVYNAIGIEASSLFDKDDRLFQNSLAIRVPPRGYHPYYITELDKFYTYPWFSQPYIKDENMEGLAYAALNIPHGLKWKVAKGSVSKQLEGEGTNQRDEKTKVTVSNYGRVEILVDRDPQYL